MEATRCKITILQSWFGDWRVNDSTQIVVTIRQSEGRGQVKNNDTDREINISRKVFAETESHTSPKNNIGKTYLPYIRDIIRNAVLLDSYGINPTKSENSILMHSFYAVADIGNGDALKGFFPHQPEQGIGNQMLAQKGGFVCLLSVHKRPTFRRNVSVGLLGLKFIFP